MSSERHVNLHGRCKVCQLLKKEPALFDELHRRLIIQKQPVAQAVKWLNGRIEMRNLDRKDKIKPFNTPNIHTHLKKHVIEEGQLMRDIALKPEGKSDSTFSEIEEATANMMLKPEVKAVDPETELEPVDIFDECETSSRSLIHSLRLNRLSIEKELKSGNCPNLNRVKSLYDMLDSVLCLQKTLTQIQNSSKIAGEALRRMAEMIAVEYAQILFEITGEAEKILSDQIDGSLPSEVTKMIRSRMGSSVGGILESAYKTTIEEFGIK